MKTKIEKVQKRTYFAPQIERVILDNEISLALESPPLGPFETSATSTEYFSNDPYKNHMV